MVLRLLHFFVPIIRVLKKDPRFHFSGFQRMYESTLSGLKNTPNLRNFRENVSLKLICIHINIH